ncbi:CPBP family intramembrane metalloprotease [Alicyclobacillus fastidiosus]|uniref:CPBP family intramembrane metalloprotease n=1 Tax=Alicyclobacillus fastidiosus TaxID=392011 RepID=A0ABY6ZKK2_9BACL|nr:CPBP family intramembrane glutamic endopeptidase [Alicyclobacillus fastidiosus]WAH43330.1 CPBP family intramembrane metalloprotease [Alicyclobacillus fastidiosus]GMA65386.1 hypothetical protein GCM10025859_58260 [Alicyclobacillus fastidiosus]
MTRWTDIPRRFAVGLRPWQIVYMMFFAAFGTFANLYNGPDAWVQLTSDVYLLTSVGSLFVLLPNFRRTLFRDHDPLRENHLRGKKLAKLGWRLYLYLVLPAFFIALVQTFSALISSLISFGQSNVPEHPGLGDYLVAVFAGLEEVWRWSMIGAVLVVLYAFCRGLWHHAFVRGIAFTLAFVLSSLSFGAGHILEFQTHRVRALFLFSGLGALLALMTVVTGRILLIMCVHMLYDVWVTYLSSSSGHDATLGLLIYIALLAGPVVTLLWRRHIFVRPNAW